MSLTSTFVDLGGLGFMRCPLEERWKADNRYFIGLFPRLALTLKVRLLLRYLRYIRDRETFYGVEPLLPSSIHCYKL